MHKIVGVLDNPPIPRYLKGDGYLPFAVVSQPQNNCITRVMTRTCDLRLGGRAYDTVGISRHLRSTPGGPSALHQGPLPPFNPDAVNKPPKLVEGAGCISRGGGYNDCSILLKVTPVRCRKYPFSKGK